MMNQLRLMPSSLLPTYLPPIHYPKHGQEASNTPTVLDLCMKKRPSSPNLPHDYKDSTPNTPENTSASKSSETSTDPDATNSGNENQKEVTSPSFNRDRPFKAYPIDPLAAALMGTTTHYMMADKESADAYSEFRKKMLSKVQASYSTTINKNMRRIQNTQNDDPTYLERRKKNNEAAKRSRDARKAKEDEIAIRCAFLEQENVQLRIQVAAIEKERENLQKLIFH